MTTVGISYRVQRGGGGSEFSIIATYVVGRNDGKGFLRQPTKWRFSVPVVDGLPRRWAFGASETLGLLGGASSRRQAELSEGYERALGDVLTTYLCEILDSSIGGGNAMLLISGVAFPKLIGRVLSLRPPEHMTIAWIWSLPFSRWSSQGVTEAIMLDSLSYGLDAQWEDEPLIRSYHIPTPIPLTELVVQQLCLWRVPRALNSSCFTWKIDQKSRAALPRESLMASVVAEQLTEKVNGKQEEGRASPSSLRQWAASPDAGADFSAKLHRNQPPGWNIRWR